MVLATSRAIWFRQDNILRFLSASKVSVSFMKVQVTTVLITLTTYGLQLLFSVWLDVMLYGSFKETLSWFKQFYNQQNSSIVVRVIWAVCFKFLELIQIQGCAVYIMPRLLLIFVLIHLSCLGLQFEEVLEKSGAVSVEIVMKEYEKLRKTVDCVNSWLGGTLLSIYICILAILANLPGFMRDESETKVGRIYPLIYGGMVGIAMVIGCDLPKRVNNIHTHITTEGVLVCNKLNFYR